MSYLSVGAFIASVAAVTFSLAQLLWLARKRRAVATMMIHLMRRYAESRKLPPERGTERQGVLAEVDDPAVAESVIKAFIAANSSDKDART